MLSMGVVGGGMRVSWAIVFFCGRGFLEFFFWFGGGGGAEGIVMGMVPGCGWMGWGV